MPPRPASPPPQPAAPAPSPAPQPAPPPGERVGVVTHYYGHVSVAIVRLESGMLRVGDTIHIRGHTTDFSQRVQSMEVEHAPASEVGPNDDFGLKVIAHVREHDVVYKVK
jgi:putative protease